MNMESVQGSISWPESASGVCWFTPKNQHRVGTTVAAKLRRSWRGGCKWGFRRFTQQNHWVPWLCHKAKVENSTWWWRDPGAGRLWCRGHAAWLWSLRQREARRRWMRVRSMGISTHWLKCPLKDRLGDQRGRSEWEPIKFFQKVKLGLCPKFTTKDSHTSLP
jgi:hypothetical protein